MSLKLLLDLLTGNMALVNVPSTSDISGGLDNLLLVDSSSNLLLVSAASDVLLLMA